MNAADRLAVLEDSVYAVGGIIEALSERNLDATEADRGSRGERFAPATNAHLQPCIHDVPCGCWLTKKKLGKDGEQAPSNNGAPGRETEKGGVE